MVLLLNQTRLIFQQPLLVIGLVKVCGQMLKISG